MIKKVVINSLFLGALVFSSGCGGLLIGSAVGGAVAAATIYHDRRTPGTVVDDKNIELVATKKLLEDPAIDNYSHTNLTIYNRVVLVTGEASSKSVKDRIIKLLKSIPNVKKVESDISIMPNSSLLSRSGDSAITTKTKASLLSLEIPNFEPSLINISTERGHVYLMGIVTPEEAEKIIRRISRVSGVQSVTQLFEIKENLYQ